jgi:FkbM family methyltransferase
VTAEVLVVVSPHRPTLREYLEVGRLYLGCGDRLIDKAMMALYLAVHVVYRTTGHKVLESVPVRVAGKFFVLRPWGYDHGPFHEIALGGVYFPSGEWRPPMGGWVIDVGANIGVYTVLCGSLVSPGGRVDAIEPNRGNYSTLLRNIQINQLSEVARTHALGAWSGSASGELSNPERGAATWSVDAAVEGPVTLTALDQIVRDCERPVVDILKIDTEGSEVEILRGATETLRRTRRVIIETHSDELAQQVDSHLRSFGFERAHVKPVSHGIAISGYTRSVRPAAGREASPSAGTHQPG